MNLDTINSEKNKEKLCIFNLDQTIIKIFPLDTKIEIDPKNIIIMHELEIIVIKRSGFDSLMDFVFDNYHVGFWSSNEQYYTQAILIFCLKHEHYNKIKFVWSQKQCRKKKMKYLKNEYHDIFYYFNKRPINKSLHKLWKKTFTGGKRWNRKNTLIIEDMVDNCAENYGNAIYLNHFNVENYDLDLTLLYLNNYLTKMLDVEDFRKIDKRNWLNIIKNNK